MKWLKILHEKKQYYGASVHEQFINKCVKIFPYEIGNITSSKGQEQNKTI